MRKRKERAWEFPGSRAEKELAQMSCLSASRLYGILINEPVNVQTCRFKSSQFLWDTNVFVKILITVL